MADDWQTPEHEAAACDGFLANPVAVAYARAQAEGAVPLQAGEEVEVEGVRVACQWSDRIGVFRILDPGGAWREVDLAKGPDAHKKTIEWHAIPGTQLELREVEDVPRWRWHVR
ncbi:MAG TPA: hypothetical protein VFT95_14970, partial [Micromonosporaceae bacterium]|nr:hypothetical protein [Micromonosporaceae bacterium]